MHTERKDDREVITPSRSHGEQCSNLACDRLHLADEVMIVGGLKEPLRGPVPFSQVFVLNLFDLLRKVVAIMEAHRVHEPMWVFACPVAKHLSRSAMLCHSARHQGERK